MQHYSKYRDKYIPSQYRCVAGTIRNGKTYWYIAIKGVSKKLYEDEREVAILVDKYKIERGLLPVNILKPKL